jgi:hydroxylysine kinase
VVDPTHQPGDLLSAQHLRLEDAAAVIILATNFGLVDAEVTRLPTERDDTFRVRSGRGDHVLKVAHPDDDPLGVDLQNHALAHAAAADPSLAIPRLVPNLEGSSATLIDPAPRLARLLTFLPGTPLRYTDTSTEQRRGCGVALARLSLALRDCTHVAADRRLLWDLQHLGSLRPLVDQIPDDQDRAAVLDVLDVFDQSVQPRLIRTHKQLLHNDFNPDNVLVDSASPAYVSGILDFGDVVQTYLAVDLAVAMSYAVGVGTDPWEAPFDVVAGYLSIRSLTVDEIDLLPDLVLARLAQRLILNSWMSAELPDNAAYTARNIRTSTEQLRRLRAANPPKVTR